MLNFLSHWFIERLSNASWVWLNCYLLFSRLLLIKPKRCAWTYDKCCVSREHSYIPGNQKKSDFCYFLFNWQKFFRVSVFTNVANIYFCSKKLLQRANTTC